MIQLFKIKGKNTKYWAYFLDICRVNKTGTDIVKASEILRHGGLVAIPTETVYGLAANALDAITVAKIFEAKKRPHFDPLIIHTNSLEKVLMYVENIPEPLLKLAKTFWPGPLTLLLPKKNNIPDLVTSGLDTVAVRIPKHALTLEILSQIDFPLAAPSANPFGYISPTKAEHVYKQLGHEVDYIIDGGSCEVGLESSIIGMENGKICIYRLGGLSVADIESVVGHVELKINQSSNPKAPGQLKSHYAPKKSLIIGGLKELEKHFSSKKLGIICFGNYQAQQTQSIVKSLSLSENYNEAASNLFSTLRELDESDCDLIICSLLPEEHLGLAINDRLRRAAAESQDLI